MSKKQWNILRNVSRLYSCGPPKVPTDRTASGKKMSEQAFYDGKRTLHRIFSHTFYWWTVARRKKKSPPNKQFIPHHLSRVDRKNPHKKLAKLFFLVKAKIIFFRFGLLESFLLLFLLRLMEIPEEMFVEVVKREHDCEKRETIKMNPTWGGRLFADSIADYKAKWLEMSCGVKLIFGRKAESVLLL